ncbi:protein of unknown function [Paraburkholderia kururiensis]
MMQPSMQLLDVMMGRGSRGVPPPARCAAGRRRPLPAFARGPRGLPRGSDLLQLSYFD